MSIQESFRAVLGPLFAAQPHIPDPAPIMARQVFSYEQLKEYRLMSAPYIVSVNYDTVESMIEDGITRKQIRHYEDWLSWVAANV